MDTSCLQVCYVLHACCVRFVFFYLSFSAVLAFLLLLLQVEQPSSRNPGCK